MSAWVMFWVFATVVALLFAFKDQVKVLGGKLVDKVSVKSFASVIDDKISAAVTDIKSHVSTATRNNAVAVTSVIKEHVTETAKQTPPAQAPEAPPPTPPTA